ncbi:MAG: hypothetical protein AAFO76_05155, partial [Cyanobacteria bacterium J06607_15]
MKIAKFRYTDIHSLSIQFTVGGCSKKNYRTSQSKRRIITNLEYYDYWRDTAAGNSSEIIIREPIIIIIWQYPIGVETKAFSPSLEIESASSPVNQISRFWMVL